MAAAGAKPWRLDVNELRQKRHGAAANQPGQDDAKFSNCHIDIS
jgi:hypothetical protein